MADQCLTWDAILQKTNTTSRCYEIHEAGTHAALSLRARRGSDWFFARRWVDTAKGRRNLYRIIDVAETAGYRFQCAPRPATTIPPPIDHPATRAADLWAQLTPVERGIHRDLFPDESRLLDAGYDWDNQHVYHHGATLQPDRLGRLLETEGETIYEWVRVPSEHTWRRYPIDTMPKEGTVARAANDLLNILDEEGMP
jgi:hypothetical protein